MCRVISTPYFFIAGYPKSGTTALYYYLQNHPDVFLPAIKEPHYFSTDFSGLREIETVEEYCELYKGIKPKQMAGDASASVIHSEVALVNILELTPNAKFIVILREPVAAARSFHAELLYNLNESVDNFETAWNLQNDRKAGNNVPTDCREPKVLQYRDIYRYRDQMPRFFELVPPERRLVLIFEEFFVKPLDGYCRVLDFLGLPYDGRVDFENVNSAKSLRFRWLTMLHKRLINSNGALYKAAKDVLAASGIHPSSILARFNVKKSGNLQLSPDFEARVRQYFEPDVKVIESLLGRSIDAWKN